MEIQGTPPPAADAEAKAGEQAADKKDDKGGGSDILEVILEGMEKPTKIPLDKIKPDLAKFRADADRKLSEADRRAKELDARDGKYKSIIEKAKEDPDAFSDLAKELGLTEEQLDQLSERRVAKMLDKAMREAEESKDPAKREARERDENTKKLQDENSKLKADVEQRVETERMQRAEGLVISVLDKLGPMARNPEAAQEVVWTLRTLVNEKEAELGRPLKDISELGDALKPENLAKSTVESWARSVVRYYEAHPDADLPDAVLKRAETIIDKRRAEKPKHPAEGKGGTGAKNGNKRDLKEGEAPAASEKLLKYLRL